MTKVLSHPLIPVVAALFVPFLTTLALVSVRGDIDPANTALILVVAVVAVAALGNRVAGPLAALFAGLWFDVLLVPPYGRLTIADRADVVTMGLLLVVGLAVSELAWRGRQQQAEAARSAGYLLGIQDAVQDIGHGSPGRVIEQAAQRIGWLLGARCRFDYGTGVLGGEHPRLLGDGRVEMNGQVLDVMADGLPDRPLEILITDAGHYLGRFVVEPARSRSRPARAERLAAALLAQGTAQAIAASRSPERSAAGQGWKR